MFSYHQTQDISPMGFNAGGLRQDHHIRGHRCDAGCHDSTGFLILYQAKTAGTEGFKIRVVTECGNLYTLFFGGI
jgi:hypothetical protein